MNKTQIDTLTDLLAKLPALGPRSARRAVLFLLKKKQTHMMPLITALTNVFENVRPCPVCGNMDTTEPCAICSDARRDKSVLCIVADVADLWALERANIFHGTYHVLGGVLSAMEGVVPEDLNIESLEERIKTGEIKEYLLPARFSATFFIHDDMIYFDFDGTNDEVLTFAKIDLMKL